MRVLHIWNTAGVASVIAKYQRKLLGWDSWVIMRKKYDIFDFTTYGETWDTSSKIFVLKAIIYARKYDIVHIHSLDKLAPIVKLLYPRKTIILHYHGSDIRGKWKERQKYWSYADLVLVSTTDLLEDAPKDIIYLPNPVDTELFYERKDRKYEFNSALYFIDDDHPLLTKDLSWSISVAKKFKLKLTIHNRRRHPIKHSVLPSFLSKFEYYIDRHSIPSLSKTALESLACGLKVIRWDEKVIEKLPNEHKPENVIKKLVELILQHRC